MAFTNFKAPFAGAAGQGFAGYTDSVTGGAILKGAIAWSNDGGVTSNDVTSTNGFPVNLVGGTSGLAQDSSLNTINATLGAPAQDSTVAAIETQLASIVQISTGPYTSNAVMVAGFDGGNPVALPISNNQPFGPQSVCTFDESTYTTINDFISATVSDAGTPSSVAVSIQGISSGVPVPISGTVTANLITGFALDTTLAKLTVAQNATLGSNTGAMVMGSVTTAAPSYSTGHIQPLSLSTTGLLRVDASGAAVAVTGTFWQTTQPVSGTITANAGTNLNTSALALETGGNLATIATRTPALGQALAAASVPVILPSATITTLTPPTAVGLNAGSALVGQIGSFSQTDTIYSGTTALTVQYATIACGANGDNTLVALSSGKKIKVLSMFLVASAAVNFYIHDTAASPVNLLGSSTYVAALPVAGSGFSLPLNQFGHFITTASYALVLNLSAAVNVSGFLTYVLE